MVSAESSYATDVASAKQRIKILKSRLARRAAARQGLASGKQAGAQVGQGTGEGDEAATAAAEATGTLKSLIASHLLSLDATQLPTDSQSIQKKLSKGDKAADVDAALVKSGHASLQPVFEEMADGKCFTLDKDTDEKESRLWIDDLDHAQLLRLTGQDTTLRSQPSTSQPDSLPQPPAESDFTHPQAPRPGMSVGQPPMGPGPPPGVLPHFPGPPNQPSAPIGPGSQGGPVHPMHPAHSMQMAMPGPGHFGMAPFRPPGVPMGPPAARPPGADLDALLSKPTVQGRARTERGEEFLELIQKPTAKESATVDKFRTAGGPAVREYCPHPTKEDCCRAHQRPFACDKLHFKRLIFPWTDPTLGDCSYLDTCRNMKGCKHIHYELDDEAPAAGAETMAKPAKPSVPDYLQALGQPQWITCDIRTFDMSVLGKFGVIMADPPWEIHQDLPYGTMADDEMRKMNIKVLQDDGVIFLWVTELQVLAGRAMELGRECLQLWGYKRVDELIWVKTNQLQRLIRTGRTGHWLNHSKEHCLVGVKGSPQINRNLDCDVLVAEVRETSRKPDEMYSLLERLSPGTRKLEIFARSHNVQPGWVCLGNQLDGTKIADPEMLAAYTKAYGNPTPPKRQVSAAKE